MLKRKRSSLKSTPRKKARRFIGPLLPGGFISRPVFKRILMPADRSSRLPEVKSVDTTLTTQIFSTTGTFTVVNAPVEGAAFYQRVGRKINMKSVHIRGAFFLTNGNAAAITVPISARLMLVYDRQANGAMPVAADILTDYSTTGATTTGANSGINMNNRDRFHVLMDMQVILPPVGINGASPASTAMNAIDLNGNSGDANQGQYNVNRFIRLRDLETIFKSTAGGIGDVATGALLLFAFGQDTNGSPAYNFGATIRLKYKDS